MLNYRIDYNLFKTSSDGVNKFIENKRKRFDNMIPVLKMIAERLRTSAVRNIKEQDRHKQLNWSPLSPFTLFVKRYRAKAPTSKPLPLQDTGRLVNSIFPAIVDTKKIGEAFAYTRTSYAKLMNDGGTSQPSEVDIGPFKRKSKLGKEYKVRPFTMNIKSGHNIPARPFMVVMPNEANDIFEIMKKYIYE